ncbi:hypothetical protein ACQ4PT_008369 [Festuca glaucescens]
MVGVAQSVQAMVPTVVRSEPPEIPLIDMSSPYAGCSMADAARQWGIFQAVNHGVPKEALSELQRVGREFFSLPQAERQRYAMDPSSGKTEGYGSTLQQDGPDGKKTWSDFLFHNVSPPAAVNHAAWPENPAGYREANEAYSGHMWRLTRALFEHLSAGLGLEEGAMAEAFGGDDVVLLQKINFYPPCPQPELALGVAPHTDLSTVTVLVPNDVPGLQVLSNGTYKAVLHRTTVSKEKTRMSWPVFVEPPTEHVVGPHPQLVTDECPAKYKGKKFGDYKYCKINKLPL